jgi:hypothetical protein
MCGPPKISLTNFQRPLFLATCETAAENKLFSAAGLWPLKIISYFRLIFFGGQEPPKMNFVPVVVGVTKPLVEIRLSLVV